MSLVVNTHRNQLADRTSWRWYHVARPVGLEHDVKLKVEFLAQDGRVISQETVVSSEDRSYGNLQYSLTQGIILRSFCFPVYGTPGTRGGTIQMAFVSPFFVSAESSRFGDSITTYFDSYSPSLVLTRTITFTPEELARMTTIRCSVSAAQ